MMPKFIGKTKISKQGQITLPFEARKDLNIAVGSEVYWYELKDFLIIVKDLVSQKELLKRIKKIKND